jgi:SET domain-containing protein
MNLSSYRSSKSEIKKSPINGKGLFAIKKIAKGEIVAIKGGSIAHKSQWEKLEKKLGSAEIQVAEEYFIAPTRKKDRETSMLYTNHSCDPNIGIQGQIVFVAMRDIEAGEELTHDWATTDDLDYKLECNCGSPDCRGIITGKDWMKKELQEKYRGYFAWYLQKKIDGK